MTTADELTARQHRAIAALLVEDTREAAARVSGVGERTLRRWETLPAFAAEVRRQRTRLFTAATTRLVRSMDTAIGVLNNIASGRSRASSARVQAARAILTLATSLFEKDELEPRLAKVEEELAQRLPTGDGGRWQ
jgi:hypothetical protein